MEEAIRQNANDGIVHATGNTALLPSNSVSLGAIFAGSVGLLFQAFSFQPSS